MFFLSQSEKERQEYVSYLRGFSKLSRLFSDSNVPYIPYRFSENLFCLAFNATNVSRTDCSADAMKQQEINLGFGIKTFLEGNGKSFQKIAEFNRDLTEENKKGLQRKDLVEFVSRLRNKRIQSTHAMLGLDNLIYHCIVRNKGVIKIFEQGMDYIDIDNLDVDTKSKILAFSDGRNEYQLNLSKSTLYKRFISNPSSEFSFGIEILEDPYSLIRMLGRDVSPSSDIVPILGLTKPKIEKQTVMLPLYSPRDTEYPKVPERSGLNQWNARGRARHEDEVYIPIPSWIHKNYPDFFPPRESNFQLLLPNQERLSAKVCQSGDKALMSNPNQALGHWILRDIFKATPGELVTYESLKEIGIDSVEIRKIDDTLFEINFKKIGSYAWFERFYKENAAFFLT